MIPENRYVFIGRRIREAREKAGISQKDLADALGYESATAISLIEAGKRTIEVSVLDKTSKILKRDIKFFLGEEDATPTISYALRADPDLDEEDEKHILKFVDFVKNQK